MDQAPGYEKRSVRITTTEGVVEGCLRISTRLRTLDDLNMVSKRFVMLHAPMSRTPSWQIGPGVLAVNKDSLLFLQELSAPPPLGGARFGSFTRAAVRLKLRQHDVEGFVHVPPGGEPIRRLDQTNHSFVSLTSVLICSPGDQQTAPFLAVNRNFITAAQVAEPEEGSNLSSFTEAEVQR